MNLSETYARVCAVRPELAVTDGSWCLTRFGDDSWDWTQNIGDNEVIWRCEEVTEKHAAALILARWVEALPELICIHKRSYGWVVGRGGSAHSCPPPLIAPTPIEALAAFYLGEKA